MKIIKIGGGIIDDELELQQFLLSFSKISGKKILVHGGGKGASCLMTKMNIVPQMIEGRRVTDKATLDVVTGLYAGNINKKIVGYLQKIKVNALGLSGADGNAIQAKKRPVKEIDYGFVGDLSVEGINTDLFKLLIDHEYTPVVCAITHDAEGQLLNTNADTIASVLARAMAKYDEVELYYCFDKIGVLKNVEDEASLIPKITKELYEELKKNNIVTDGMIPKLDNAFEVLDAGVKKVYLTHARNLNKDINTVIC